MFIEVLSSTHIHVVVAFPGQTTLVLMRSEDTIPQPDQGNPNFVAGRKESSPCDPATQH